MTTSRTPRRRRRPSTEVDVYEGDLDPDLDVDPTESLDLGSISEIEDGEHLVLRSRDSDVEHGVPTTTEESAAEAEVDDPKVGIFGKFVAAVRSYGTLRRTIYGISPALVLGGISFFSTMEAQAYAVARPFIVRSLEVNITSIVQVSQYIGIVTLFASLWLGWFLDRNKRAPWVGIGAIGGGLMGVVSSRATSLLALGAPRVVNGVFDEVGGIPRFSLLADYYPPEARGKVFSLLSTLRRTGSLLGVFLVGFTIERYGWRFGVVTFSIPVIAIGVVALIRLREPVRGYMERKALGADDESARVEDEPQSFGEAWRSTFSVRTLRRLFIADSISAGGDAIVGLFFSLFLVQEYGLSPFQLSIAFLPGLIAALIGGIYGGALIDRFIRHNPARVLVVLGVYSTIGSLGVIGYAFKPPLFIIIGFSAITSFGAALIGPASGVVYSQVIPANIRTQGLQVTGLASLPGLVIFIPIANALFASSGFAAVFLLAAPMMILGGLTAISAGSFFDLDVRSAFAANLASQEWKKSREKGKGKLLVCRDVDVDYDGVQVLFNVDFDVNDGEIIALLGTNGAGKSTLLKAISGSREASGGAIVFDGRDITHMPPHEVASRGVIHMPGGRGVFPGLTVRENLELAGWMSDDPAQLKHDLAEVFEIFPILKERAGTHASALSGGEQQQLSLAQAFLSKPKLLMIDELSLGLSPAVVGQLLEIVREIHRRGVTIIVVEQSVNVALELAEKAIFMEKGEVKFFGSTADLLARPDILRAVYVKGTGALTDGAPATARRDKRAADAQPVLVAEGLTKRYGGVTAVEDAGLTLREGEVLGLIGPNGAGKTTMFELISGFQEPDAGHVFYEGVDITKLSPEERARQGLVRRFQDARLFPSLTVFETLLVALEQRLEVRSTLLNAAAAPQARRAERRLRVRAERLIELLELGSYRDKFVKELSTGLRRIVDLACVLAAEPKVLMLDEPSSGIAQAEAEGLAPLLRRIKFETGCSILIIEHDMPLISAVSDELLAMERGRPLLRGTPEEVLNDERVIESYLGSSKAAVNRSGSIK
jgi:ABC-type branched-subunit amino acid transport system ATPase component/MFS family permease